MKRLLLIGWSFAALSQGPGASLQAAEAEPLSCATLRYRYDLVELAATSETGLANTFSDYTPALTHYYQAVWHWYGSRDGCRARFVVRDGIVVEKTWDEPRTPIAEGCVQAGPLSYGCGTQAPKEKSKERRAKSGFLAGFFRGMREAASQPNTWSSGAASDYYKLPATKRIDKDLYRSGQVLIETRYCYHFAFGEDAVLRYEGPGDFSGSKVIWQDDSTCDVKRLIRRR